MRVDGQKPDTRREQRTSGLLTAKSRSIKVAKRICGDCAWKAAELTPGDLHRVRNGLRRSRGRLTAGQKSAEGIVGMTSVRLVRHSESRTAEQWIARAGNDGRRPE